MAQFCVSFFSLPQTGFPCDLALSVFNHVDRPCITTLLRTFGDDYTCFKRFLSLCEEKDCAAETHLSNWTCNEPSRSCSEVELLGGRVPEGVLREEVTRLTPRVRTDFARRSNLLRRLTHRSGLRPSKTLSSFALEHRLPRGGTKRIARFLRRRIPGPLVSNPKGAARRDRGFDLIESHSYRSLRGLGQPCVYSNDGADLDFGGERRPLSNHRRFRRMHSLFNRAGRRCDYVSLWWDTQSAGTPGRDPRKRAIRLDRREIHLVNRFLRRKNGTN